MIKKKTRAFYIGHLMNLIKDRSKTFLVANMDRVNSSITPMKTIPRFSTAGSIDTSESKSVMKTLPVTLLVKMTLKKKILWSHKLIQNKLSIILRKKNLVIKYKKLNILSQKLKFLSKKLKFLSKKLTILCT